MSLDLSRLTNVRKKADGSYTARCPICAQDGHDTSGNHLWVHSSGAYRCIVSADKAHSKAIWNSVRGESHEEPEVFDYQPKLTLPKVFPEESLAKLLPDTSYWEARGVRAATLAPFGGGLAALDDKSKLSGRYVFPCRNARGQLVGFAGRLVEESSFAPKWKIIGKKSHFVCPIPEVAALGPDKPVILVEGIGCVLALAGVGVSNTLCLFGLTISGEQIAYLVERGVRRIVIATNNEASGIGNEAALALKYRLSLFFNDDEVKIHLPPRKDFLDCAPEEIEVWKAAL